MGTGMVVLGNFRDKSELRRSKRKALRYTANILTNKDGSTCPCTISDISETGARLLLYDDCELPDTFVLLLTSNGKAQRFCNLVWRDGKTIGVKVLRVTDQAGV